MALSKEVLTFTKGDSKRQAFYAQASNYMKHYTAGTMEDKYHDDMRKAFMDEVACVSGISPDVVGDLAVYANFSSVQEAAFSVISIMTQPLVIDAAYKAFAPIAEFKNGAFGDSFAFDLTPRDLFVVTKGARSQRDYDIHRQYKATKTIVPEWNTLTVGISLYEIMTGKQNLAEFISKAQQSLTAQLSYDVYDAFSVAMNALATAGDASLKVSGYTQKDAIKLAQKIQAWTSSKPVFLGTKLALSNILPASSNYQFNLGDEYVSLGHLRDFFGFSCIELEQIADYKTEFATKIADDEIYIVPQTSDKFVKVCTEGSMLSNLGGVQSTANLMTTGNLRMSWGVGVITGSLGGMIKLA